MDGVHLRRQTYPKPATYCWLWKCNVTSSLMDIAHGISVKAMVIVRRPVDGALLVTGEPGLEGSFERPPGGTVEFGEHSSEAARREFLEEFGLELQSLHLLGVLENRFEYRSEVRHEIVFVYGADLADLAAYNIPVWRVRDHPKTSMVRAYWRDPHASHPRLVPSGLRDLIDSMTPDDLP